MLVRTNPVIGVDSLTVQGYFYLMANRCSAPRQTGGSTRPRSPRGSKSASVARSRTSVQVGNRTITVKHSMPQLWLDMIISGIFGIFLGLLSVQETMILLSLLVQLIALGWYQLSLTRTIRRAVAARIRKGR